jgi:hypothetical protein
MLDNITSTARLTRSLNSLLRYRCAGLIQACDWLLADQVKHHSLLESSIKAVEGTGKDVLDCIDWAELGGHCGMPKLTAVCIEHLIEIEEVGLQCNTPQAPNTLGIPDGDNYECTLTTGET